MSLDFVSVIDVLELWSEASPKKKVYTFLNQSGEETAVYTYEALLMESKALATLMLEHAQPGDRAVLLYPQGKEYVIAFWACLFAGIIAVPAYPPTSKRRASRVLGIMEDTQPTLLLSTKEQRTKLSSIIEQQVGASWQWLDTENAGVELEKQWARPAINEDTLAFLQYTSGSTGRPKGVMVSHKNLLVNQEMIQANFGSTPDTKWVYWLPVYHDMGLIGGVIQPAYAGSECVLMSHHTFLQKPIRWLQAISKYKATITGAPNFAYDLCVEKISEQEYEELDLSSLKVFFSGAEPVRYASMKRFYEKYRACGFEWKMFFPCYGMAETTLFVTGAGQELDPVFMSANNRELEQGRLEPIVNEGEASTMLVSSGREESDYETVLIVNVETGTVCEEGTVGEIWIQGGHVALGYWNNSEATQATFENRVAGYEGTFLRTGDLGCQIGGEFYITGRCKDLIILRGKNYYPQDIELVAEESDSAFRKSGGAAFAIDTAEGEKLVVLQELERTACRNANVNQLCETLVEAVWNTCEVEVSEVVLLRPGGVSKTSSGKVQRSACKREFLADELKLVGRWKNAAAQEMPSSIPSIDLAKDARTQKALANWLVSYIAKEKMLQPASVNRNASFASLGMGSLDAIELSGQLSELLGKELSPTLAYDYSSIHTLSAYLAGEDCSVDSGNWSSVQEPIAIVSAECRMPEAANIDAFWDLLDEGRCGVREVPDSRWDVADWYDTTQGKPGKMNTRFGGFLQDVDLFDHAFFQIPPKEAEMMDPQQRLLMEVSWHALERANISFEACAGGNGGVFIGICNSDYMRNTLASPDCINAFVNSGSAFSIAANRLSYFLDWHGPSVAVDTACSSSLSAIHQACQSLRQGECNVALAGGVNLILRPELTVSFSQAQMMSPTGLCHTFDAEADGYVRGEGCGMVVLKRLSDAERDGDRIMAVIRGSAMNQDGRSNGLTAPNSEAQQAVVRSALKHADVEARSISYVEVHGTGTSLGDPLELNALRKVIEPGRKAGDFCRVGSVKTNVGHLEAAAGVAGLLKTVLSLQKKRIPKHLHFKTLNPAIQLGDFLNVAAEGADWSALDGERLAGVSAFSFGGTNVHMIVEEAPERNTTSVKSDEKQHLLVMSANDEGSLSNLASGYADFLERVDSDLLEKVCATALLGRTSQRHRLAVVGHNVAFMREQLLNFIQSGNSSHAFSGAVECEHPKTVFMFTGQGSQYAGMGQSLYEHEWVFREALNRCHELFQKRAKVDVLSLMFHGTDAVVNNTANAQVLLFSLEYALYQQWASWGVRPDALIGHSLGEITAACVAEVITLEDAVFLVSERARLMAGVEKQGVMFAIQVSADRVTPLLDEVEGSVSIASVNGPESLVVAGDAHAVEQVIALLGIKVKAKKLSVSHAFHSTHMHEVVDPFKQALEKIEFHPPQIPLISNLSGDFAGKEIACADYWAKHIISPVLFYGGMQTLLAGGYSNFVEIGPNPHLSAMAQYCVRDIGHARNCKWMVSMQPGYPEIDFIYSALAKGFVSGVSLSGIYTASQMDKSLPLPLTPFNRKRFWVPQIEDKGGVLESSVTAAIATGDYHDLLEHPELRKIDSTALKQVIEAMVDIHQHEKSSIYDELNLSRMIYETQWRKIEALSASVKLERKPWLILANEKSYGEELFHRLCSIGEDAYMMSYRSGESSNRRQLTIDHTDPASVAAAMNQAGLGEIAAYRLVYVWGMEEGHFSEQVAANTGVYFSNVLSILAEMGVPEFWAVTQGGTSPLNQIIDPTQSALWGYWRALLMEYPHRTGGIIDINTADTGIDSVIHEIKHSSQERQVALRANQRYVPRLVNRENRLGSKHYTADEEGVYLITGGLGGLGLKVAEWLVDHGANRLVLTSRRGLPPRGTWESSDLSNQERKRVAAVQHLERKGAHIRFEALEVSDRLQVDECLKSIEEWGPLRGIIHAAGVSVVEKATEFKIASCRQVIEPKIEGSWNLHEATLDKDLHFFVLFSSISATIFGAGQACYSAANAYQDGLSKLREQLGLPIITISWGPWSEVGMYQDAIDAGNTSMIKFLGINPMSSSDSLDCMTYLLDGNPSHHHVMDIDWHKFLSYASSTALASFFEEMNPDALTPESTECGQGLVEQLIPLEGEERLNKLTNHLQQLIAKVLQMDPELPSTAIGFNQLGIHSLMAMEIIQQLEADLSMQVSVTAVFNYPTIAELSAFLLEELISIGLLKSEMTELDDNNSVFGLSDAELESRISEKLSSI